MSMHLHEKCSLPLLFQKVIDLLPHQFCTPDLFQYGVKNDSYLKCVVIKLYWPSKKKKSDKSMSKGNRSQRTAGTILELEQTENKLSSIL